ncbi:MAG TPA: RecX family transcriptional regulator [Candidatus Saccharimonadales bacterium]|nr:RecX family transcriptional regulator [Candidatus Saccharimonadales bacterium]
MIVTAIKQQVRQKGRYSVFVEGKYSFSLSDSALLESKLVIGQELTGEEVKRFKQLSGDDKLQSMALRYAAMRPRSTWEMEQYLKRKKAAPLLHQQILSKLSNLNLLDDRSFAESWVASRRLLKPVSYRRLQAELRAKHVPDEVITEVLAGDETDERTTLRDLVARKRKQSKYQDQTKLMQYLARQGFSYDDIKSVLSEETEEA